MILTLCLYTSIYKSQLITEDLGPNDTVVFIDDFSGSGEQACKYWPETRELLPGNPTAYLVLVAANSRAVERIECETDLSLYCQIQLTEEDNVFSSKCRCFNKEEKETLLRYCRIADRRYPKGHGDCGLVIVFAHDCPNNSIPILRRDHRRWEGLFIRQT